MVNLSLVPDVTWPGEAYFDVIKYIVLNELCSVNENLSLVADVTWQGEAYFDVIEYIVLNEYV